MVFPPNAALVEERDGLRIRVADLEAERDRLKNRVAELRFQLRDETKAREVAQAELERVREPSVMPLGESVAGALLDGLRARIQELEKRLPGLVREAYLEGACFGDDGGIRESWENSVVKDSLEELLAPGAEEDEEAEDRE